MIKISYWIFKKEQKTPTFKYESRVYININYIKETFTTYCKQKNKKENIFLLIRLKFETVFKDLNNYDRNSKNFNRL